MTKLKRFQTALAIGLMLLAFLGCRSTNEPKAPSWAKAKVLADKEDHPSKIVSDGEAVYFVTGGTVASRNEGTNNIKKISLKDGTASILVKGGKIIPDPALAVDDKFLYWSDGGNLWRVPKGGGDSVEIIPIAPKPDEIVMDDENFYWLIWTGEGSPPAPIMYAPKSGGDAKQLTPPQPPTSGIALDGDVLYWMTGDGIKRMPKGGGVITDFYRHAFQQPSLGLQQDAENFYFCQMNERGHSALMKLNKRSGELTQLAPSINHTMEFVVADGNVYYFDEVPKSGSFGPVALRRVTTGGGSPVEIDQGNAGWIKHLATDAKQVYFTDISRVYALPK
ncbi:MAG TPA: hypothetical protein VJV21_07155 [Pyrinomonadaceae bacterium]|nr:hypothetical protein [Pyrinomonadaceae bacterium]